MGAQQLATTSWGSWRPDAVAPGVPRVSAEAKCWWLAAAAAGAAGWKSKTNGSNEYYQLVILLVQKCCLRIISASHWRWSSNILVIMMKLRIESWTRWLTGPNVQPSLLHHPVVSCSFIRNQPLSPFCQSSLSILHDESHEPAAVTRPFAGIHGYHSQINSWICNTFCCS